MTDETLSIGLLVCDEVALELQAKHGSYTDMLITWMLLGVQKGYSQPQVP